MLRSVADAQRLDGYNTLGIEFFDVLESRARLKLGKSPGVDGVTSEIWKALPVSVVLAIWKLFKHRVLPCGDDASPTCWRIIEFVGFPKTTLVQRLSQFRWIGLTPTLQKWYCRSLRPLYVPKTASVVCTFGFKSGMCVEFVVGLIREMIF